MLASPRHADGLLITGPVTQNMRLALQKTYDAVPAPKLVYPHTILDGLLSLSGRIEGRFRKVWTLVGRSGSVRKTTTMVREEAAVRRVVASGAALEGIAGEGRGKPFIKWAGGKRQLLPALQQHAPANPAHYFEPFVGGGALFFAMRPKKAVLADVNKRLIRAYKGVRKNVETVIRLLRSYPHTPEFFYELREAEIDGGTDADVAAWFIYLNKTGFNGLYRVNSKNRFNVPFGRYAHPAICDETTLRACSAALADADLRDDDFESVVAKAKRGDFVYFDPPYVPLSVTSSFTSYTSDGFGEAEQTRLRDVALRLKQRGVHVLLSNSSAPLVRGLYADGFDIIEVSATRLVNSKATARGAIVELLIK